VKARLWLTDAKEALKSAPAGAGGQQAESTRKKVRGLSKVGRVVVHQVSAR
jgi:hypothetical protein